MSCLNFEMKAEEAHASDAACQFDPPKCQSAMMDSHTAAAVHRKMRKTKRLNNMKRTYGLRPRTQLRRPSYECEMDDKDAPAKREHSGGKVRGSIVAKCRRLNANARERQRMKEINDAFVTLQGILPALEGRRQQPQPQPQPPPQPQPSSASTSSSAARASMTKIRTLRHAASYIQALSDLLSGSDKDPQNLGRGPESSSQAACGLVSACNNNNNTLLENAHGGSDPMSKKSVSGDPLSWNDVEATDEELFSLLEKEVLSMRKSEEGGDCALGGINWSDDLPPLG